MPKTIVSKLTRKDISELMKRAELIAISLRTLRDLLRDQGVNAKTKIDVTGLDQTMRSFCHLEHGVNKIKQGVNKAIIKNEKA